MIPLPAAPAAAETREDVQGWLLATAMIPMTESKDFSLYVEAQPRTGDDLNALERLLVRPAVVYNVTPRFTLWLGYAWTPLFMDAEYRHDFRDEHRAWEQAAYSHTVADGFMTVAHRFRQEQRFIEFAGDTAHRSRYQIRVSAPWKKGGTNGMTGYNELFWNWNDVDRGPRQGFDRDRFFLGPYWVVGKARYEAGYLGEYSENFGGTDRMIHGLLLSVNYTFE